MKLNFLERCHAIHCSPAALIAGNEDIFTGDPATDVISMKNADSAVFMITTNANAGTGAASVWVYACDDTTPTNSTAVSFYYKIITAGDTQAATTETLAFTTNGLVDTLYVIEVPAIKVAEQGREFVQLHTVETQADAVDGAIVSFLTGLRDGNDDMGTQLT